MWFIPLGIVLYDSATQNSCSTTVTDSQDKELVPEHKSVYRFLHQKGKDAMKKMSAELSMLVT